MTDTASFLHRLSRDPGSVEFDDTLSVIDAAYTFTPTAFSNGRHRNAAGENNGSCKLFFFAQLHGLSEEQTLACFGHHYRHVLATPGGSDHLNIRNFIDSGWSGIAFEGMPLTPKHG